MALHLLEALIYNDRPEPLTVVEESSGNQFTVRPGTMARIKSENLRSGERIEVVVGTDRVEVWAPGVSYIEYDGETL